MIKIYIASPYTKGDVAVNVRESLRLADYIASQDVWVKPPLLTHFWHMLFPRPYEFWLKYDMEELRHCTAVVRMAGESNGADKEVAEAIKLDMPVHYFNGFDIASLNKLDHFIYNLKTTNEQ